MPSLPTLWLSAFVLGAVAQALHLRIWRDPDLYQWLGGSIGWGLVFGLVLTVARRFYAK